MRGSTPEKRNKHLKICKKLQKHIQNYLYIYVYFYGFALVSSGRDLDAPKRGRDDPNPKTRMLGVTPIIFCKVDVPKTCKQVVLGFRTVVTCDMLTVTVDSGHLTVASDSGQ